jgi:hypothetical protein
MNESFVRSIGTALIGSFIVGAASAQQQSSDEAQLLQLEKGYCTAHLERDAGWLGKLLADDYTGVHSRGGSETKNEAIASLKDPKNAYSACVEKDMKARVYGDAAVVTGRQIYSGSYKGEPFKDREVLWTDTFIRKGGRWQVVASHSTAVKE